MMETLESRPETTKPCPDCGADKRELFYLDSTGRKTNARCKPCHKAHTLKRWHSMTQEEKMATRVRAMYGIEPDEYLEMCNSQQGKCAICGNEPTTQRGLHLDHCHDTGQVRGLLCHGCNTGLGAFSDDPELLAKAIGYLRS